MKRDERSLQEIIYGRQPVREVIASGSRKVYRVYILEGSKIPSDIISGLLHLCPDHSGWYRLNQREFNKIVKGENHQGIAISVSSYSYVDEREIKEFVVNSEKFFCVFLYRFNDPHNVGAVIRSCEAFGVNYVFISRYGGCGITPAVVKVSAGATEHIKISVIDDELKFLKFLKDKGVQLIGIENLPHAYNAYEFRYPDRLCLIFGSEGEGIRKDVLKLCDVYLRIPMKGKINSLNVSVAAGIILFCVTVGR